MSLSRVQLSCHGFHISDSVKCSNDVPIFSYVQMPIDTSMYQLMYQLIH